MAVHLEITDGGGFRSITVDSQQFWIGTSEESEVRVDLPGCHGRVLEVKVEPGSPGRIAIRGEAGLPFPVRCVTGNVGSRFETMIDGDILNVGPALVKLKHLPIDGELVGEELDLSSERLPGAPVGSWYRTFMDVADHLEGLTDPRRMIGTALEAVLHSTNADRACLELDRFEGVDEPKSFFYSRDGECPPFRVSRSLIDRVLDGGGRVVHVPIAEADPVASQFVSVRKEGISSGIALPLVALGRSLGVLYADCVRDSGVLTAEDLQRVVFIGRLLASALGSRDLVSNLVKTEPSTATAAHPALQTSAPACSEMVERVRLYAPTDYTVLLRGETGTGKEVIAKTIHDLSRRKSGPFVPVNCAAIPEQLMESMLFGHEKGAFTGASQSRPGHFEEAHGGTLFLDEIGDMALDLQAKILRVLQDRVVSPVGASRQIKVDVRIIAATHQDLEQMADERRFREDLYYRLRELEIRLPSLRERSEDLLMLCGRFLADAARELQFPAVPELSTEALDHLHRRRWRGNIRELQHMIKGAVLRASGGAVQVEHLDAAPSGERNSNQGLLGGPANDNATWKERLEAQERAALKDTLDRAAGNLTKAAQLFGVPRTTYREKLVKNGLLEGEA